jgi:hypothetical protein
MERFAGCVTGAEELSSELYPLLRPSEEKKNFFNLNPKGPELLLHNFGIISTTIAAPLKERKDIQVRSSRAESRNETTFLALSFMRKRIN